MQKSELYEELMDLIRPELNIYINNNDLTPEDVFEQLELAVLNLKESYEIDQCLK